MIYRAAMAFFTYGIFVASLTNSIKSGVVGYWPIYFTSWGVMGLMIHSSLAFAASIERLFHERNGSLMRAE